MLAMRRGTYILPGGRATSRCIAPFEEEAIKRLPYVRDAFGDAYEYAEKRVVAPIRMGGIAKSYGEQCLIVGDAAGHVDPLTGKYIHMRNCLCNSKLMVSSLEYSR